ncbi:hypothetical protein K439DRAFT_902057 [Ramaria rubella]|nr:hypothetical protein K439DRAFT_902057 [Ramaria rubella]
MHLNSLYDRDGCPELASCPVVSCPGSCDLKTQSCSIVAESCPSTCEAIRCDPLPNQSSGGSGPSPGTLAGAVIAALLFLGLVVLGYLYYRRREKAKEAAAREKANADAKPDIPACADTVLSRPDPHLTTRASIADASEKPPTLTRADSGDATELGIVRVYSNHSDTTIDLDSSREAPRQPPSPSTRSNPFADGASIQTTSDRSQSTNVIPIALVPPGGHAPETLSQSRAGTPIRPARSPEVTLNDTYTTLDHAVVSDSDVDEVRAPYTGSTRSGISGKSFMTTSSLATDLDESTIMTPKQGVIRQVFGMSQAQVVRVPSSASSTGRTNSANYSGNVRGPRSKPTSRMSKATLGRSPLAQQSFTPADIPLTNRESLSPPPVAPNRI